MNQNTKEDAVDKKVIESIVEEYRRRATRLRRDATISIIAIILSLLSGISIFYLAGDIAARERKIALSQDSLKENREELDRAFSNYNRETESLSERLGQSSEVFNELAIQAKQTQNRGSIEILSRQLEQTNQVVRNLQTHLNEANQGRVQLQREFDDYRQNTSEKQFIVYIVSSIATRVGSVLLLIFLVQILLNLYRYNSRLAAHYEIRADALELAGSSSGEKFERITSVLSTERIDFGKAPTTPTQQILETASKILSFGKTDDAKGKKDA